jgi:hypothetical protein
MIPGLAGIAGFSSAAVGGGPISFGDSVGTTDPGLDTATNRLNGAVWTASASGTVNFLHIRGAGVTQGAVTYRLLAHAVSAYVENGASSTATVGALLGSTANMTGITAGADNVAAVTAPFSVTAGQMVLLSIHSGSNMRWRQNNTKPFFSKADTFADGSPDPYGAASAAATAAAPSIWATTE